MEIIGWLFVHIDPYTVISNDVTMHVKDESAIEGKHENLFQHINPSTFFDFLLCTISLLTYVAIFLVAHKHFSPFLIACKPTSTYYKFNFVNEWYRSLFIHWLESMWTGEQKVLNGDVAMSIEHQLFIRIEKPNSNWISFGIDRNHIFYTHSLISVFGEKQIKTKQRSDEELKA